jgi:hypothetical protein
MGIVAEPGLMGSMPSPYGLPNMDADRCQHQNDGFGAGWHVDGQAIPLLDAEAASAALRLPEPGALTGSFWDGVFLLLILTTFTN